MFHPAGTPSVVAFVGILVAVVLAFLAAIRRAYASTRATLLAVGAVAAALLLQSAFVASGRMGALPFEGAPFFFAAVAIGSFGLGFSKVGGRLAATIPLAALVVLQGFRLPLELVLHRWFEVGTIPESMTWSGQNLDVVAGTFALLCAPFASKHRVVAWMANVVGIVLLANVMRVAAMSTAVPFGWHLDPPLRIAAHLPYAFIGPVCVGGAAFGHVVLTRALLRDGVSPSPSRRSPTSRRICP